MGSDLRKKFTLIRNRFIKEHKYCERCGALASDVHHIVPLIYGGTNDFENLSSLCKNCHKEWEIYEAINFDYYRFLQTPSLKIISSFLKAAETDNRDVISTVCNLFFGLHEKERAFNLVTINDSENAITNERRKK